MVMVDRGVGVKKNDDKEADDDAEESDKDLDLKRRVARWGYYHGRRDLQGFFIKHS